MKKSLAIALALTLVMATLAVAGVVNTKHDMSTGVPAGLGTGTSQVCVFCHHPHRGADGSLTNDLLWNLNDAVGPYSVYTGSATFNGTDAADLTDSAPQSFLCMACHDGTIAAGALVKAPADATGAQTAYNLATAADLIGAGTDELTNDHPINFNYVNVAAVDSGIEASLTGTYVLGTYPLYNNTMQCATCHDVHMGNNSADINIQFMRASTADSKICTDCHTNK